MLYNSKGKGETKGLTGSDRLRNVGHARTSIKIFYADLYLYLI